jgi:hypothetical protein
MGPCVRRDDVNSRDDVNVWRPLTFVNADVA